MTSFIQDLRRAVRTLRRHPASTAVVVLTLALGIGANTAIFSVVRGVLLKPLPYPEPERLMKVSTWLPGFRDHWLSPAEYFEVLEAETFERAGAWVLRGSNVAGGSEPARVEMAFVSASLFDTLGVAPVEGRTFTADEDRRGGEQVIVLGHGVWQRFFGGDRGLVGRTIEVDGVETVVVGVMPPGFDLGESGAEAFVPVRLDPTRPGRREARYLTVVGRLAAGVDVEDAAAELAVLVQPSPEELADGTPPPEVRVRPWKEALVGGTRPVMALLLAAVGVVLLIACANVIHLLLARAESRRHEIAVRAALGAGRRRLLRHFLTESLLLALPGAALGLAFAYAGLDALLAGHAASIPRSQEIAIDLRVLGFTLLLTLATALVFGVAPALHVGDASLSRALAAPESRAGAVRFQRRRHQAVVVSAMTLAVMLALAAGLLARSFHRLVTTDPGFEPAGLVTLRLFLPFPSYPEVDDVTRFYDELTARLAELPGAEGAAALSEMPLTRTAVDNEVLFEDASADRETPRHVEFFQYVTEGFFDVFGLRLLAGRFFNVGDRPGTPGVVVVNEAFGRKFFPDGRVVGRRLRLASWDESPWLEIVGVASDVKQAALDRDVAPEIYLLHRQSPETVWAQPRTMVVAVRTALDEASLLPAVRRTVRDLDPRLPLASVETMDEVVSGSLAAPRLAARLVGLFAVVALALAAVGVYGVLAYSVERRRHEIGVRLALGAERGSLVALVLGEGLRLAGAGIVLGLALAWSFRRLLAGLLYGVEPGDPVTFAGAAALLAAVALAACLVPARRATRIEALSVLRYE